MIEENGLINQPNPTLKQRSLLSKFDISIDHLSFEYIGACKDIKELERIVRILRSGEEGYFPDLQNAAEKQLRSLSPNNRHLRVEEPALTRQNMSKDEWNNVNSDVSSWKKEMSVRDLRLTEENNNTTEELTHPPVRKPPPSKRATEKKTDAEMAVQVKGVNSYAAWDKYDADAELLKMDLEQERHKEEREKHKLQEQQRQADTDRLEHIVKEAEKLSDVERKVLAEQEKNRGNEYYEAKDYTEAIKYYTASIAIYPTPNAYNNRAACYLKHCQFSKALDDANSTLAFDPKNVKALFRRGISLQHKNMFREALADMNEVLRQQPKHLLAQHYAKELREQVQTQPRTVRIMVNDGPNKPKRVMEMSSEDLEKESLPEGWYEVNEFNLPKVMCQCSEPPRFLQLGSRKCATQFQPRPPVVNNAKIIELSDEPTASSTKLEIVEVNKLPPTEDFYKPSGKCVVVDRRTQKNIVTRDQADVNLTDDGTNLSSGDSNTNSASGESGMDEDFELRHPLLGSIDSGI